MKLAGAAQAEVIKMVAICAAVVAVAWYVKKQVSEAADSAGNAAAAVVDQATALAVGAAQAVNPTSDQNVAYKSVNAVGASITGQKDFNLGSWLYDVTHP